MLDCPAFAKAPHQNDNQVLKLAAYKDEYTLINKLYELKMVKMTMAIIKLAGLIELINLGKPEMNQLLLGSLSIQSSVHLVLEQAYQLSAESLNVFKINLKQHLQNTRDCKSQNAYQFAHSELLSLMESSTDEVEPKANMEISKEPKSPSLCHSYQNLIANNEEATGKSMLSRKRKHESN